MKKLLFSLCLLGTIGYFYLQYPHLLLKEIKPLLGSATQSASNAISSQPPAQPSPKTSSLTKCITADGRVLYGDIPSGTLCQRIEPVRGNLSILPSQPKQPTEQPAQNPSANIPELKLDSLSNLQQSLSELRETLNQRKPVPDDL